MTDFKHVFIAVQWASGAAFELVALPDDGPATSVTPWAVDAAGLDSLQKLLAQQGHHCCIVVDGEKDKRLLKTLPDVSAYEVVNAAPRLRLASAQAPMVGFFGGNQQARLPREDAESDARAMRMGWRGSKQFPSSANPYAAQDLAAQVAMYAKRFHHFGMRLVVEVLEVAGFSRYTWEHGARLAMLLQQHVCGREGSLIGDYSEWVGENRLACFYVLDAEAELIAHARGTQAKALRFLEKLDQEKPSVTVHLSYCNHDVDDEGWDSQAILEAAMGLREARCRVRTP